MKLLNIRQIFTANSTIGKLFVDGEFLCYVMEPTDRGLESTMDLQTILKMKLYGKTAIPIGIYPLQLISGAGIFGEFPFLKEKYTITGEAGKRPFMVPELQGIKDFDQVLFHPGNYPKDTKGCSLVGDSIIGPDFIGRTDIAFYALEAKCFAAIKAGGVTYEIQRDAQASATWQAKNHSAQ